MTAPTPGLGLRRVEVDGAVVDVRIAGGAVVEIGPGLRIGSGDDVVDGRGGALVPGLHDHHTHLRALAAARRSVVVGPPAVTDADGFVAALRTSDAAAPPGRWLRAVGYHDSVAGPLDRDLLDRAVPGRPVRVQHRSGALWCLNGPALAALAVDAEDPALERDGHGRPTGRFLGADRWLRERLPTEAAPPLDLAAVGAELAGYGVTGVTDATPVDHLGDLAALAAVPQRVRITGGPGAAGDEAPAGLERGPVKLVLADHALPALDDVVAEVQAARAHGRAVAVHAVTRAALVLALAAWDDAGARPGDRVEHGAVVDGELTVRLRDHGLVVVTQPGFVAERGDRYLVEVDEDDRPHLWPCRSLLNAGVPVAAGTDAPFGHPDPWRAVAAAVRRRTAEGRSLGPHEAVDPTTALGLLLAPLDDPGGVPRRIVPGAPADLCLLDAPLAEALADPSSERVAGTLRAGRWVFPPP